jgi:hypothetical protein
MAGSVHQTLLRQEKSASKGEEAFYAMIRKGIHLALQAKSEGGTGSSERGIFQQPLPRDVFGSNLRKQVEELLIGARPLKVHVG